MTEPATASEPNGQSAPAAVDRAALLAELEALSGDSSAPPPAEPESEPAPAQEPATPAEEPAAEPEPEPEPEDEPDTDDEATDPAAKPDEPTLKGLAAVHRAAKRKEESLARARRELDEMRSTLEREWKPRIERALDVEKLAERAKYDPAAVLEKLGLTQDDFELAARQIYARSKAAAANPQTREAAERAMRERERADELSAVRRELETMKQEREAERQAAANERHAAEYIASVESAVSDETPLIRNLISKSPSKAREQIAALAAELYESLGEIPDPCDLAKEFETRRRAELDELGVDLSAVVKTAPKPKTQNAGEKRAAKTLSANMGAPTKPRADLSDEELREDILRGLQ